MTPWVEPSRSNPPEVGSEAWTELRALLVAQLRTNAEQAATHEATARELAQHTDADSVIERELAEVCATRAREAVQQAEEALGRMAAGTYGACEACGAPIPLERLQVIPQARRCVACPSRRTGKRRELSVPGSDAGRS